MAMTFAPERPALRKAGERNLRISLRRGDAAGSAEGFDAAEDGGGSFAGDGLVGNGFKERFVGRLVRFHFGLEGSGGADEFGEDFVASAEVFVGGGQVEGKSGRLVDQRCVPRAREYRNLRQGEIKTKKDFAAMRFAVISKAESAADLCLHCLSVDWVLGRMTSGFLR